MKKKVLLIVCLFVTVFSLMGCSFSIPTKKSPEVIICDPVDDLVDQYNNNLISYSDLVEKMLSQSKEYCEENGESDLCTELNVMKKHKEAEYILKDCDTEPDNFQKSCEIYNELMQLQIDDREATNDLYVSSLKRKCDSIRKK